MELTGISLESPFGWLWEGIESFSASFGGEFFYKQKFQYEKEIAENKPHLLSASRDYQVFLENLRKIHSRNLLPLLRLSKIVINVPGIRK